MKLNSSSGSALLPPSLGLSKNLNWGLFLALLSYFLHAENAGPIFLEVCLNPKGMNLHSYKCWSSLFSRGCFFSLYEVLILALIHALGLDLVRNLRLLVGVLALLDQKIIGIWQFILQENTEFRPTFILMWSTGIWWFLGWHWTCLFCYFILHKRASIWW